MSCRIIEWSDTITDACGWIVFDTVVNGISGGGIFIDQNASLNEVKDLARTMSYKHLLYDPMCGGAKAGIKFDPFDKRAKSVLERFLIDNQQLIKDHWITAADLNTSNSVIHSTLQDIGLGSGFFVLGQFIGKQLGIKNQSYNLEQKISQKVDNLFTFSEAATGYSVFYTINFLKKTLMLKDPAIIIQGFGAVGSSLAYFINKHKLARIVGIIERDCYISNHSGIDINHLTQDIDRTISTHESYLLKSARKNTRDKLVIKAADIKNVDFLYEFLLQNPADIFVPCASRYQITQSTLEVLNNHTFSKSQAPSIISGANNPFFDNSTIINCKNVMHVIPSWVSNIGNAVLFVESLKCETISNTWQEFIFSKIEDQVKLILENASLIMKKNNIYDACYQVAHDIIKSKVDVKIYQSIIN